MSRSCHYLWYFGHTAVL